MSNKDWKVSAEIIGLKTRSKVKTAIRAIGVLLVCLAGYNMLLAPATAAPPIGASVYTSVVGSLVGGSAVFFPHLVVMVVGAVVAWFI